MTEQEFLTAAHIRQELAELGALLDGGNEEELLETYMYHLGRVESSKVVANARSFLQKKIKSLTKELEAL